MSNQANLIIKNLKQLIDKLQSEKSYFITQVENFVLVVVLKPSCKKNL